MRSLRFWLSILVSVVFLWLAFRGQDLSATWAALSSAHYWYLVPAVVLYFLGVWVRSVRWKSLLSPIGKYTTSSLFPVVVIGYMANDVLPARMGEVVRVYVLAQRERISRTAALGTVVVERLLDALTMMLLLGAAALLVPLNGEIERVALVAGVVLLLGMVVLMGIALAPAFVLRITSPLLQRLPGSLAVRGAGIGNKFLSGLQVVRSVRVLSASFLFSVIAWLLEGCMYWVLAQAFDLKAGVPIILLTLAVANLATLVPAGPGYVGSFEFGALLVLANLGGIARELATGYVLVVHATLVVPVVLLGLYYWGTHHLSLYRIRRDVELSQPAGTRMEPNAVD